MFERFTEPSRAVVAEAQDVAVELGSHHLTVAHLLCACTASGDETAGVPLRDAGITVSAVRRVLPRAAQQPSGPVDAQALREIGIDYDDVRAVVEQTFGAGALDAAPDRRAVATRRRRPSFTPEAKRALVLSLRAAQELRDDRLRPGHLLLGVLRVEDPYVMSILHESATSVAGVSADVLTRLSAT